MRLFRGLLVLILCLVMFVSGSVQAQQQVVKNVIYMIPDGFSIDYLSNYRIYKKDGNPIFDSMLVGMMKTRSADNWVTDSETQPLLLTPL